MSTETLSDRITRVLDAAGVPKVTFVEDRDDDAGVRATAPGYRLTSTSRKMITVAIIGRDGIPDSARQSERDGIMQVARQALVQAGLDVSVNEYGHLRAREV